MLRALKWAYSLGVRQERVRISAHLQNISRQADFSNVSRFDVFEKENTSKQHKQKLEFDIAVDKKIKTTIEDIMRPEPAEFRFSTMFPNDKHNGEIK